MHGRIAGESGLEFGLGTVRLRVGHSQAVVGGTLGTPMWNQFHDFAIGEMSGEKQVVFAPAQVESQHDQTESEREDQWMLKDEGQHAKA